MGDHGHDDDGSWLDDGETNSEWCRRAEALQRDFWKQLKERMPPGVSVSIEGGTTRPYVGEAQLRLDIMVGFKLKDSETEESLRRSGRGAYLALLDAVDDWVQEARFAAGR